MGKRGPLPKQREPHVCATCGDHFVIPPGYSLKQKYCSLECNYKGRKGAKSGPDWLKCCQCLGKIGLQQSTMARITGLNKGLIHNQVKRYGLQIDLPPHGSWVGYAKANGWGNKRTKATWWGGDATESASNAAAWISEYNPDFPDWSKLAGIKTLGVWIYKYMKDSHALSAHRELMKGRSRVSTRNSIKKRKTEDPVFRVQCNLRGRLKDIMRSCRNAKASGFSGLTGCTTAELRKHLERQFKRGMTWRNYGTHWHVDHIIPCAKFDHAIQSQREQCWHWTNLRPLEARKNMEKSDTITEPQLSLLLCAH